MTSEKDARDQCDPKCPRYAYELRSPCLAGSGNKNAKLMIVGRDPGQREDKRGMVFVGPSGELLNSLLEECGVSRDEVYVTNAVKCGTPDVDKEPGKKELLRCRKYLLEEIKTVSPNVVLALGGTALESLLHVTGIARHKNNIFISNELDTKVVSAFHPAHALREPLAIESIRKGIELAVTESKSKEKVTKAKLSTKVMVAHNAKQAIFILNQLLKSDSWSFDIETSDLNFLTADILCVQFSWKSGVGAVIPWGLIADNKEVWKKLHAVAESPALKIAHNIKFDLEHLSFHGIKLQPPFFDTIVAYSLIDDNSPAYDLGYIVLQLTDMGDYWSALESKKKQICKEKGISAKDFSFAMLPREMLYTYGAKDADATFRIYKKCKKLLVKEGVDQFFYKYSMPLVPVLVEMELRGVRIDRDRLRSLKEKSAKELASTAKKISKNKYVRKYEKWRTKKNVVRLLCEFRVNWSEKPTLRSRFPEVKDYIAQRTAKYNKKKVIHKFNMSSAPQKKELLHDMLKLPVLAQTKTGAPSLNKEVMEVLSQDYDISLLKLLSEYTKTDYFLSSFLVPTYERSALDGRIHTSYIQFDVRTGRLSSRNPNMQNLPRDEKEFRSCFLADPGFVMVKADLAQAEFRVWAHDSNDTDMIADIESGLDIHRHTASEVFGVSLEEVTKLQRDAAKRGTFGMMYGIGSKTLARRFHITLDQAKSIIIVFRSKYPVAVRWIRGQVELAHAQKHVVSFMGRKRRLPHIDNADEKTVAKAERQAMNSPVQAAASDMNNYYMVLSVEKARKAGIECYPCMTTHDENIIQVRPESVDALIDIMKGVAASAFDQFRCRMDLEFKVGPSIGEAQVVP